MFKEEAFFIKKRDTVLQEWTKHFKRMMAERIISVYDIF